MATFCNWDRRIDKAQRRFKVLHEFDDEAVLDKETGLVWERAPSIQTVAWPNARLLCAQKAVGGRGGWRLPAFNELASLVDPAVQNTTTPQLPPGHPFLQVEAASYWSNTHFADEPGFALVVVFQFIAATAGQIGVNDANIAGGLYRVWAVRGGSPGPDSY
jgi:Protein of unknown function (DUF1566)